MVGNPREFALNHFFVETLHIVGSERRHQGTHLVEDATERPDVTLAIVWLITPHFRTCVVRSARLRVTETFLNDLTDIKVSKFGLHVLKEEQIRTLHVSVENPAHMECPQPPHDLYKDVPDLLLFNVGLSLLIVAYFLKYIAVISVLHHEAQTRSRLIDESIAIRYHIRVIYRCQDPHFVECILLLLLREG